MEISASELKKRLADKDSELVLIDVREDWEHEMECITPNNISLYDIPKKINEFDNWAGKDVVLHCKSGKRSRQAQKFLRKNGYTNIISLSGGLDAFMA
jgi:rhodanese-related sulfurtransferase